ncbi:MAG: dihydropteroate synthase [Candidatus Omnitrophota bacterium]|nr:dihydropteroate synthase [Candidatus Omnitrophota bacterium]
MSLQILSVKNPIQMLHYIRETGCDPAGCRIMSSKGLSLVVKIKDLNCWQANILKQEMLSLNGDVAVAKGAITGKLKKTDCIIMGNLSQISRLIEKLKYQPPSLNKIAQQLKEAVENSQKDTFTLKAGRFNLGLGKRTLIMGVVNVTADSFSGDGLLTKGKDCAIPYAEKLIRDGADILDIGGESTRPGARAISSKEEIKRVIPLIKYLSKRIRIPISVDTYKSEVAKAALGSGAVIVNDIMGLKPKDPMLKVLKSFPGVPVVVMHIKGKPRTMQKNPVYKDLMFEIIENLAQSIDAGMQVGISKERFIVDPGIGFGKALGHNLEIIRRLSELKILGRPILIGTSRKSFIGKILHKREGERIFGTAASVACAIANGAKIVRVHDVLAMKEVVKLSDAILSKP